MNLDSINTQKLGHAIARRRRKLGVGLREISEATGISPSTLSRVERNVGKVDADNLAALCVWLDMPIANFVQSGSEVISHRRGASLIEKIEAVLDADPTLDQQAKDALADLMAVAIAQVKK